MELGLGFSKKNDVKLLVTNDSALYLLADFYFVFLNKVIWWQQMWLGYFILLLLTHRASHWRVFLHSNLPLTSNPLNIVLNILSNFFHQHFLPQVCHVIALYEFCASQLCQFVFALNCAPIPVSHSPHLNNCSPTFSLTWIKLDCYDHC